MHDTPRNLHKTPRTELYVVGAGTYTAPKGRDFPPHQHVMWEVVYYRTGHIPCPVGNEIYQSQPGMLLLTPPYTMHAEYATEAYSNIFIVIDAPAQHPWPYMCLDDAQHTLGNLCSAIIREWEGHATDHEAMVALLVNQFDILLRRSLEQEASEAERLVQQVEYMIVERSSTSITIKDIAQEIGVSPSYLRAQFARFRQQSPMEYLQRVRLHHAMMLLGNSTSSLATIANICGYDSPSHLSRYVKRATGKSPGSLRSHKIP